MDKLTEECRDNEVPCGKTDCEFYDTIGDQNCCGDCGGWPAIATCKDYEPVQ